MNSVVCPQANLPPLLPGPRGLLQDRLPDRRRRPHGERINIGTTLLPPARNPARYVQVHGQIQPLYTLAGDKGPKMWCAQYSMQAYCDYGRVVPTEEPTVILDNFQAPHFQNLAAEKSLFRKLLAKLFLQTRRLFFSLLFQALRKKRG